MKYKSPYYLHYSKFSSSLTNTFLKIYISKESKSNLLLYSSPLYEKLHIYAFVLNLTPLVYFAIHI